MNRRQNPKSKNYDYKLIAVRLKKLIQARNDGDVSVLINLLRSDLLRNLGSIGTTCLYNRAYSGTKLLIEDYINEVIMALEYIDDQPLDVIRDQQRRDFFHDTRQSFGLSALVLHGGSLFGLCHIGTVKVLHNSGLLPGIICGSTVGAIVGALVCSCTEDELPKVIDNIAKELPPLSQEYEDLKYGSVFEGVLSSFYPPEIILFEQYVRNKLGNLTFEEAYLRSGKVLNITITPVADDSYNDNGTNNAGDESDVQASHGDYSGCQQGTTPKIRKERKSQPGKNAKYILSEVPRLLNYLSTPNVIIWSAVRASIGSGILQGKTELLVKNHLGEIEQFLQHEVKFAPSNQTVYLNRRESPYTRLAELFNVNNFIVSLARPYLAPILLSDFRHRGHRGWGLRLVRLARLEFQHRLQQLTQLGILPGVFQRVFVDENIPGGFQVTIVPELSSVRDFAKVFDGHNIADKVNYWIWIGERSVWPMMAIIWARSAVEIVLNSVYTRKGRELRSDAT
ncbi:Tgl3p [Sugiyamaella lignohabitans]|uniref:Tgl3p n=1 Tax=Sugiyamaella lignohabitans TaxID=796027 RepID=A0A167D2G3_9ASCO|nr:Tgl3p [Sugiyamaella lignohabitans]ANB12394.1 Tgl3p [Sugiyamaella lignohabitans]